MNEEKNAYSLNEARKFIREHGGKNGIATFRSEYGDDAYDLMVQRVQQIHQGGDRKEIKRTAEALESWGHDQIFSYLCQAKTRDERYKVYQANDVSVSSANFVSNLLCKFADDKSKKALASVAVGLVTGVAIAMSGFAIPGASLVAGGLAAGGLIALDKAPELMKAGIEANERIEDTKEKTELLGKIMFCLDNPKAMRNVMANPASMILDEASGDLFRKAESTDYFKSMTPREQEQVLQDHKNDSFKRMHKTISTMPPLVKAALNAGDINDLVHVADTVRERLSKLGPRELAMYKSDIERQVVYDHFKGQSNELGIKLSELANGSHAAAVKIVSFAEKLLGRRPSAQPELDLPRPKAPAI